MRKSLLLLILFILLPKISFGEDVTEVEQLTFYDRFNQSTAEESSILSILDKKSRVSSNAGKFNVTLENIPDSIATCIYAAVDIWESVIQNESPIYLTFKYSNIESGNDIETSVQYYSADKTTFYPKCLYYNIHANRPNNDSNSDAIIAINQNSKWDCSHSNTILSGTKNMTYALLRSIATALGFGASVTTKDVNGSEIIVFGLTRGHSIFDYYVQSSSGNKLSDIANRGYRVNSDLESFVQPTNETIYVQCDDKQHNLYAPAVFQPYKSLVYLNDENSLMHYNLVAGNKYLQIDNSTKKLLSQIGWTFKSKEVEIIGVGIEENGIASAYESHQFNIQNNTDGEITNASWSFSLPLKDGTDCIICEKTSDLTFEIPAIGDDDRYRVNINGDIYGEIVFTGIIDGNVVTDTYRVSLELKPKIKSVNIIRKESNAPYDSYNLYYTVEYYGSNMLKVEVEEDYSYEVPTYYIYEPFVAHIVTKNISSNYYAWVDITVENEYGTDTYTIELPPYSDDSSPGTTTDLMDITQPADISNVKIYSINGVEILSTANIEDVHLLQKGMYILKLYREDNNIRTIKYFKR